MHKRGFTIIELMITVAIGAVIFGVTTLTIVRQRVVQNLDSDTKRVESFLRDAQQRSITGEESARWGLRLERLVTGDTVKLVYAPSSVGFVSASYPGGTGAPSLTMRETYRLKNDIYFRGMSPGDIKDIAFSQLKGVPINNLSEPQAQAVALGILSGSEMKLINISANGTIKLNP